MRPHLKKPKVQSQTKWGPSVDQCPHVKTTVHDWLESVLARQWCSIATAPELWSGVAALRSSTRRREAMLNAAFHTDTLKKNTKPWQFLLRVWVSGVPDVRLTVPTPGIQECKPTQDSGVLATAWNPGVQTSLFRRMEALFVIQLTEIVNLGSKTCPQIVFEYMYVY